MLIWYNFCNILLFGMRRIFTSNSFWASYQSGDAAIESGWDKELNQSGFINGEHGVCWRTSTNHCAGD